MSCCGRAVPQVQHARPSSVGVWYCPAILYVRRSTGWGIHRLPPSVTAARLTVPRGCPKGGSSLRRATAEAGRHCSCPKPTLQLCRRCHRLRRRTRKDTRIVPLSPWYALSARHSGLTWVNVATMRWPFRSQHRHRPHPGRHGRRGRRLPRSTPPSVPGAVKTEVKPGGGHPARHSAAYSPNPVRAYGEGGGAARRCCSQIDPLPLTSYSTGSKPTPTPGRPLPRVLTARKESDGAALSVPGVRPRTESGS